MPRLLMLPLFAGLFILTSSGSIIQNHDDKEKIKEKLGEILRNHLAANRAKFPGKAIGFALYVKSAGKSNSPDIFVSSGFPQAYGASIQFRAASTSKSFTAAGILK